MLTDSDNTQASPANDQQSTNQGWKAELKLGFARRGDKTVLAERRHKGPLTLQRPFYPEGGLCHVYLLHPPGGIVAGDQLALDVQVDSQAQALITTPGAAKFYRSMGKQALQKVSLSIKEGASLEWLPQESIVFEGASLVSDVRVDLAKDARFIGWEILALGRPAADESFQQGEAILNWQIYRDESPLFLEKIRLDSTAFLARWGLNHFSSCGTLFASGASNIHLDAVRTLIADSPRQGVTLIDDLLICRASADKTETIRHFFEKIRSLIRNDIVQKQAYTPRIWAT